MIWTRNLQKDSAHFIFIVTFSKGAINAPCGDISRLTLSSTSRKSSLRRYLMPSRRQPICPVTWLVIWDCSSFVWETGRENVSLLTKVKRGSSAQIISMDQHIFSMPLPGAEVSKGCSWGKTMRQKQNKQTKRRKYLHFKAVVSKFHFIHFILVSWHWLTANPLFIFPTWQVDMHFFISSVSYCDTDSLGNGECTLVLSEREHSFILTCPLMPCWVMKVFSAPVSEFWG